jgi:hypothetical protein
MPKLPEPEAVAKAKAGTDEGKWTDSGKSGTLGRLVHRQPEAGDLLI